MLLFEVVYCSVLCNSSQGDSKASSLKVTKKTQWSSLIPNQLFNYPGVQGQN